MFLIKITIMPLWRIEKKSCTTGNIPTDIINIKNILLWPADNKGLVIVKIR